MEINELRSALRTGVPLLWQGKMEYERAVGYLSGILIQRGPDGEEKISGVLSDRRGCTVTCRPEELRVYDPVKSEK